MVAKVLRKLKNLFATLILIISISPNNLLAQTVYVCTGSYAYAYHSISNCPGLNNCKGSINYTSLYSAVSSLGRKPCCRCWSNVQGNCHDDNSYSNNTSSPYYGGGGGSEGVAIVIGVVIVATVAVEAALISNDFYFYPCKSFYRSNINSNNISISRGNGYLFGFRKNFNRFAIEYGTGVVKFRSRNNNANFNYGNNEIQKWPVQFNVTYEMLNFKMPERVKLYVGLTGNHVFDFGYGAIIGANYKIFDRLKFDLRYEFSTQTNQVQAGLIFKYQKDYYLGKWSGFWRDVF